jgi:hypothetical protein
MYHDTPDRISGAVPTLRHTPVVASHLSTSVQRPSSYNTCRCATPRQFRLTDTTTCKNTNFTSCQDTNNRAGNRAVIFQRILAAAIRTLAAAHSRGASHTVQSEYPPLAFRTLPPAIPTIVPQIVQLWAYRRQNITTGTTPELWIVLGKVLTCDRWPPDTPADTSCRICNRLLQSSKSANS